MAAPTLADLILRLEGQAFTAAQIREAAGWMAAALGEKESVSQAQKLLTAKHAQVRLFAADLLEAVAHRDKTAAALAITQGQTIRKEIQASSWTAAMDPERAKGYAAIAEVIKKWLQDEKKKKAGWGKVKP